MIENVQFSTTKKIKRRVCKKQKNVAHTRGGGEAIKSTPRHLLKRNDQMSTQKLASQHDL